MEQRRFGPTRREIPVIGQGTWYGDDEDRAAAVAALRVGLDLGLPTGALATLALFVRNVT